MLIGIGGWAYRHLRKRPDKRPKKPRTLKPLNKIER